MRQNNFNISKTVLFVLLAFFMAKASFVLSAEKASVEKHSLNDGVAVYSIYWNEDNSIEKTSIVGEGVSLVEYYEKYSIEDGVMIQKINKALTEPKEFKYDLKGDVKIYHKDRTIEKVIHYAEADVIDSVDIYKGNIVSLRKTDIDYDGIFNEFMYFDEGGKLVKSELDHDNDGVIDQTFLPGRDF